MYISSQLQALIGKGGNSGGGGGGCKKSNKTLNN
jgi:hypothetical protein